MKLTARKHKKPVEMFDVVNTSLVVLLTVLVAYPLYFTVIASFSSPEYVSSGQTLLWVKGFTVDAYKFILMEKQIWSGYANTIFYTICTTIYNLAITFPCAYAMSKRYLPGRFAISWYFFITMYVGGGMIPTYLVYRGLNLVNTVWCIILGPGISCYNMLVVRSYFSGSIPEDLYDAARIDGASELRCFTQIAMPLAKPILAVQTLFNMVASWNGFYKAMLYLQDDELYPLQLVLKNLLFANQAIQIETSNMTPEAIEYMARRSEMAQIMKYGLIIIASAPLLIAYPFVQKHFTKGIMVGSMKG